MLEILLANPRGFCAGVERAIQIVEQALLRFGAPIYVRHEIVHNKFVVESLKAKGAIFVDELDQIPDGAKVIFSAHGVSEHVVNDASNRGLFSLDATCPLVTKVHLEAKRHEKEAREIILIGHKGHPEVEGTAGQVQQTIHLIETVDDVATLQVVHPDRLAFVTQTTLSVDDTKEIISALRTRFPSIVGPDTKDICYATQNRQDAVKTLANQCDLILVIGATNSSNSNRLRDLAIAMGTTAHLIDDANAINSSWLNNVQRVGITAGASAPETLVEEVITYLQSHYGASVTEIDGTPENIHFKLPKILEEAQQ